MGRFDCTTPTHYSKHIPKGYQAAVKYFLYNFWTFNSTVLDLDFFALSSVGFEPTVLVHVYTKGRLRNFI
jgi:hypothetical protein